MRGMADHCLVCGARRIWLVNSKGGAMPAQTEDHIQHQEIEARMEEERIARQQEQVQVIEVPVRRRKKKVETSG